ncbi:MAG: GtrA family protein [Phycisphaerales bacterium]|nr:GtrA family protein [Phycisphaerales bacterium]
MTTSFRQPRTSSPSGLLAALKDPTTRRQAIRYGIVGVSVNALALIAFSILVTGGMYHHIAATLVFVVAMSASYTVNRNWSFEFRGSVRRSMAGYAFIYFCAWGLNLAVLWIGIDLLGIHHTVVQGLAIIGIACLLFIAQRYWIFKSDLPPAEKSSS